MKKILIAVAMLLGLASNAAQAETFIWNEGSNGDVSALQTMTLALGQNVIKGDTDGIDNDKFMVDFSDGEPGRKIRAIEYYFNIFDGWLGGDSILDDIEIEIVPLSLSSVGVINDPSVLSTFMNGDRILGVNSLQDDANFHWKYRILVTSDVPEPATWLMMILGFGIVASMSKRRRKADVLTQLG